MFQIACLDHCLNDSNPEDSKIGGEMAPP